MKTINYILFSLCILLGLNSCKENQIEEEPMGAFSVSVEMKNPEASRAVSSANTGEFPVSIQGVKGTPVEKVTRNFESVNALPKDPIMLPIGKYIVAAHTPGEIEKQMATPYFAGEKEIEITKDVVSKTTVVCKMKNSRVQVLYNPKFKETFETWSITIDDGQGSVYTYTHEDLEPQPLYYYFGEAGVPYLMVNVVAKSKTGNTISDSRKLTKQSADEGYHDDNTNFVGGDGIDLNMDISEITVGQVGIKIDLNIAFTEKQEDVDVDVNDKEPVLPDVPVEPGEGNGGGNGGDNGGEGGQTPEPADAPQLELPADFEYSIKDPASQKPINAVFKTPQGLRSAVVKIETTSQGFQSTLEDATFDEPGALLTGAELIGNNGIQQLFDGLGLTEADGQPKKTPMVGAQEYTFPIGAFYNFLNIFPGTHTFYLTVVDQTGATAKGKLTITVTE